VQLQHDRLRRRHGPVTSGGSPFSMSVSCATRRNRRSFAHPTKANQRTAMSALEVRQRLADRADHFKALPRSLLLQAVQEAIEMVDGDQAHARGRRGARAPAPSRSPAHAGSRRPSRGCAAPGPPATAPPRH
jgi:hypothetical protein